MNDGTVESLLNDALAAPPAGVRRLLVGFSGGLDSSALLHLLATTPQFAVRAVHVHHGLHPDAEQWTQHCQQTCTGLGVALRIIRVQVANDSGEGIEAAARRARYAAFAAELQDGECLVTAHHQDDQAETVLLRLLRGSGAGGLASMRSARPFANGQHWRPLLATPRQALLDYAHRHALAWIDDPSNASDVHDRNFLRHRVMPVLRERWPQAGAALARSAALLSEQQLLLEEETARRLAQIQGVDASTLSVSALQRFSAPWRALIVRQWLAALDFPALPATGVETIEQELLPARPDAGAEFRWHGVVIHRWRDLLQAETATPDLPSGWSADWDGAAPLQLPTGVRLGLVTAPATERPALRVATRQGGERMTLPGRKHSHALKNVLQQSGIPPWLRRRQPLIFAADGELLAVGDLLLSARALAAGWRFALESPP
jgi:tRNA(Ile)-lysidine synthase